MTTKDGMDGEAAQEIMDPNHPNHARRMVEVLIANWPAEAQKFARIVHEQWEQERRMGQNMSKGAWGELPVWLNALAEDMERDAHGLRETLQVNRENLEASERAVASHRDVLDGIRRAQSATHKSDVLTHLARAYAASGLRTRERDRLAHMVAQLAADCA